MTRRVWQMKKEALENELAHYVERSPVLNHLATCDGGDEWRTILMLDTKTLIVGAGDVIERAGPVVVGIRYHERFLSQAPHPMEVVTILEPLRVHHPNCDARGMCLGHPPAGLTLDQVLNQVWAGLTFNMDFMNTNHGEIINRKAADYVRACGAKMFPITRRGLLEEPDDELKNNNWYVPFDAGVLSAKRRRFQI